MFLVLNVVFHFLDLPAWYFRLKREFLYSKSALHLFLTFLFLLVTFCLATKVISCRTSFFSFTNVAVYQQLRDFELKIFGDIESTNPTLPVFSSSSGAPAFSFGFPRPNEAAVLPAFSNTGASSIFNRSTLDIPPQEFTFGAAQIQNTSGVPFGVNPPNANGSDVSMDGSWICFCFPQYPVDVGQYSIVKIATNFEKACS